MRREGRIRVGALALLLAAAAMLLLAACGGDGGNGDGAAAMRGSDESTAPGTDQTESKRGDDRAAGSPARKQEQSRGNDASKPIDGDTSASFTPKTHTDSGGGAASARTRGGDNSIQDFGSEVENGEFEEAAAALHGYLDARAAGAWEAACGYLANGVSQSLQQLAGQEGGGEPSCAVLLSSLTNPAAKGAMAAEARQADVISLRAEDERGFLLFRGPEDTVYFMPMAKEGEEWKVGAIAASALG